MVDLTNDKQICSLLYGGLLYYHFLQACTGYINMEIDNLIRVTTSTQSSAQFSQEVVTGKKPPAPEHLQAHLLVSEEIFELSSIK